MFKLFSGSAHPSLSKDVAKLLQIPLAKSEVIRFGNSEVKVTIQEDVRYSTCLVLQPIANPSDTHLVEFFFFCDALRRQEAKKVIGFIPYFVYARQDVQHRPGECVSANVIVRFFESIGFSKIYTIDIHDEATEGLFSIPFKNLSALPLLASEVRKYLSEKKIDSNHTCVVSPDQGGIERARNFGDFLYQTTDFSLSVIEKKRNLDKVHQSKALDLYGNVKGKTVIIVDDIVTSGGTLINAINLCKERGATNVVVVVVHHDFSINAPKKLQDSGIDKFFSTNTIELKPEQKFDKLHEISVATLVSDELRSFLKEHS